MEQREVKKKVRKDNVERGSGKKRGRRGVKVDGTSSPAVRRLRDVGVEEWAWVGGLPDSDANRRRRRCELWGPGSESKNVSEKILGGKVHPGSVKDKVGDTVALKGISFAKLSVSGAIDGLGVLLSDLELLELRGKDARGTNRLIVIKEHNPSVYGLLKGSPRRVESVLGQVVGALKIGLVESGSKEAVVGNLRVSAGLGNSLAGNINEDSTSPVSDAGRARVRGFSYPNRGEGGGLPAGA
jgi:hypothetical protein